MEKLLEQIKNNSYQDGDRLILGNFIELKVNDDKTCIDVYKYVDFDSIEDIGEYDFDSDYLTSFNI